VITLGITSVRLIPTPFPSTRSNIRSIDISQIAEEASKIRGYLDEKGDDPDFNVLINGLFQ